MVIEVLHITAALYLLAGLAAISGIALPRARFGRATRWLLAAGAILHDARQQAAGVEFDSVGLGHDS